SGYTEGTIGFGVDAIGLLGVKLDSSPDRSGTGLLKRDRETGRAQDDYGEAGIPAKLRASKSTLLTGTLTPRLPVIMPNDSRLLPQTFQGGPLNSMEIQGLTLDAGRRTKVKQRHSSANEDMTITGG
ncbi:OprD family outer membrane porin, partial [Pseudomonas aeruginosa]